MKVTAYKQDGTKGGSVVLPDEVFDVPMNADLLHQAVRVFGASRRRTLAHTKTRDEVRGGGRKPWRQKGTGRARHGSIRSPIWKGGGVTFGPRRGRNFTLSMPKAMRTKALAVALSAKTRDGEVIVLESLELPEIKTKAMSLILKDIAKSAFKKDESVRRAPSVLVALPRHNKDIARVTRNLSRVTETVVTDMTALDVLESKYIIVQKDAIAPLTDRISKKITISDKPTLKAKKEEERKKALSVKAVSKTKETNVKTKVGKKPAGKTKAKKKQEKA